MECGPSTGRHSVAQSDLPAAIRAATDKGADSVKMAVLRDGGRLEVEVVPGVLGVSLQEFEEE